MENHIIFVTNVSISKAICKLLKDNLCDNEEFFSKFSNKNTLEKAFEEIKDCLNSIIPQKYADKIIELQSKGLFE